MQSSHIILTIFLAFFNTSSKVYPKGCSKKYSQALTLDMSNPFKTLGKDLISIIGINPSNKYLCIHPKKTI